MKLALRLLSLCVVLLFVTSPAFSQDGTNQNRSNLNPGGIMTEASDPNATLPLDDIVEKRLTLEKRVLPYESIRRCDVGKENLESD